MYSVFVYDSDETKVAKVSVNNGASTVDATGEYDPDTKVATVISSLLNFSGILTFP